MTQQNRPRLIEVDFPLRKVSEESVREKNVRHGYISTLHIWWARRPLAASRATALAALLPDSAKRREELLGIVGDIAPWEVVSNSSGTLPDPLILKARDLIRLAYDGSAPRVLDCFAGGGSIPLEALRLGCETYALDYNPISVLINRAALEYPQKFGKSVVRSDATHGTLGLQTERMINPLLEAVEQWGSWVLEEARKELEQFYPHDADGSIPVGYIWSRTLPCQNPMCGIEIPLMRSNWLEKKDKRRVATKLIPNKRAKRLDIKILQDDEIDFDPEEGTISRAFVRCPVCGAVINDDLTRQLFRAGKASQRMTAVILTHPKRKGKTYRLPTERDLIAYKDAESALQHKQKDLLTELGMDPVPDELLPLMSGVFNVPIYGMTRWGDLFNSRQKLSLITFSEKIRLVYKEIPGDREFAKAVGTYLAFTVDRLADRNSVQCMWDTGYTKVAHTFGRQALQMVWDYVDVNPFSGATGDWEGAIEWVKLFIAHCSQIPDKVQAHAVQGSATEMVWQDEFFDAVFTDPPYYINVPYADLSDFFYVWLKRMIGDLHPDLFATPLAPKSLEICQMQHWDPIRYAEKDKQWFEDMLTKAFQEIHRVLKPDGIAIIVFAYPKTEAWEAVINAILKAGLYMSASWPIHTEMQGRLRAHDSAALASSIYMVCRKRSTKEVGEFPKVRKEIDSRVKEKLGQFWNEGIRGADFFMSAIGPAVEMFGKYVRVEKVSGDPVTVVDLLEYVRKVVSEFALERIMKTAQLGGVDAVTRYYLLFRWTYNHTRVQFDEANKLANSVGVELSALWSAGGVVEKQKEYVALPSPLERGKELDGKGQFTTMIDALQLAAWLWSRNDQKKLKEHLAATYGGNESFWQVAQGIAEVLPEGDKEKQVLQGLLYGRKGFAASEVSQPELESMPKKRGSK